jgi:Zn finger protein HypA/HybF involved in hydrogenase expression
MPHLKCKKCQHEWDSVSSESKCEWCGSDGKVLEEETVFEKFAEEVLKDPKTFFDKVGLKK